MDIKIIYMFVVRDTLKINSNDKYYHYKKAEKSNRGGVSVQVRSLIRCLSFDVSRSDHPSFIHKQNLKVMRDTKDKSTKSARVGTPVPEIKNLHAGSRQSVINGLYNRPISQLVHDFLVEMDAKNEAYYFILEHGHFDAFKSYCQTTKTQTV
jgi:hypothetical protein